MLNYFLLCCAFGLVMEKRDLSQSANQAKEKIAWKRKRGKTRVANLRLAQVLHLIGGKSLLSRKTFDAEETSV